MNTLPLKFTSGRQTNAVSSTVHAVHACLRGAYTRAQNAAASGQPNVNSSSVGHGKFVGKWRAKENVGYAGRVPACIHINPVFLVVGRGLAE
jgi:hypothetical protein